MATSDSPLSVPNVTLAVARASTPPQSNADFSYFENFEGLVKDAGFGETYNNSVVGLASSNAIKFYQGREIISLDDPIPEIAETVPLPAVNSKISEQSPGAGRTGGGTNCALRFTYIGNTDPASNSTLAEQGWYINPNSLPSGVAGLTELWHQYDEYIPANYEQREGISPDNYWSEARKVMSYYADSYSTPPYPSAIFGATSIFGQDTTTSYVECQVFYTDTETGARPVSGVSKEPALQKLIDGSVDLGHWQRRTIHIKCPTSHDANDGVLEFWVQRLSETASPMAPDKIMESFTARFYSGDYNYFNACKMMGYTNAGYNVDTTFLITNMILSSSVNDIDQTAIN